MSCRIDGRGQDPQHSHLCMGPDSEKTAIKMAGSGILFEDIRKVFFEWFTRFIKQVLEPGKPCTFMRNFLAASSDTRVISGFAPFIIDQAHV